MDKNLFLSLNWRELKWWVDTAKRLVNDISGGARVVHIVLWPRWRNISKTNFPNLST
jgi:hypothetical protein